MLEFRSSRSGGEYGMTRIAPLGAAGARGVGSRTYKGRMRRGLKLHFGRRIGLDKVLQRERLATVLRTYRLLARMLTTTVRR